MNTIQETLAAMTYDEQITFNRLDDDSLRIEMRNCVGGDLWSDSVRISRVELKCGYDIVQYELEKLIERVRAAKCQQ